MSSGNDLKKRSSHPEGFYKKGVFKNFAKITETHLSPGLFLNKDSDWGSVTSLQRNSGIGGFFCVNSVKFLKTLILEKSERLLVKSNIFASLLS